jgi:hypothetical protein
MHQPLLSPRVPELLAGLPELAATLGLAVGAPVTVRTARGERVLTVRAVYDTAALDAFARQQPPLADYPGHPGASAWACSWAGRSAETSTCRPPSRWAGRPLVAAAAIVATVLAAALPARRAGRVDVVRAVAAE